MNTIKIHSNLYDYTVEFIDSFQLEQQNFGSETIYIIDKNVHLLYPKISHSIPKSQIYLMEAVEQKKNMDTVLDIISFFQKRGVKKDWKIVCIGGGITQDVTTLASNLFLRNLDWYFFPTTLLSMCDSCIGGKCGINFKQYKNQIGVFYPPKKIYIDVRFLDTLSEDDMINGWGELLKFSLTDDPSFYENLKQEDSYIPCGSITEYIYRGLRVKQRIIETDEFESDLRRVLNYGHTFGHALEAYTNNKIPHGKAVIWGIDVVNFIAWRQGLISEDIYYDIKSFIYNSFLRNKILIKEPDKLFKIIKTDKKVRGNVLNFVMLDRQSHLIVYPMIIDTKLENLFFQYIKETDEYDCY